MNTIVIAIDGHSGCGKTTLAKDLSEATGFLYIDTGAMYRGVTLYAIENKLLKDNTEIDKTKLISSLGNIHLDFQTYPVENKRHLLLNGQDVENKIRTPEVSNLVAKIATIKEVRQKLIAQQRKMGENANVILDGRDIGSVVFPSADLKLFVTADPQIRAKRRFHELQEQGIEISLEQVLDNLLKRDQSDINRKENPLIKVPDAICIDTSKFTRKSQLEYVLGLLNEKKTIIKVQ